MQIGFIATETYYVDHLISIWLALPHKARGPFFCTDRAATQAKKYGVREKFIVRVSGSRTQMAKRLKASFSGPVLSASFANWRVVFTAGLPAPHLPHGQGGPGPGNENWLDNKDKVDLMLVPAEYGKGGLEGLNCVVINGQPKLDRWYKYSPFNDRPTAAISFRWRKEQSALEHYLPYLADIAAEAKKKGVRLIGHGHPLSFKTEFAHVWKKVAIIAEPSFEEVLRLADVYAADCSSSSFEFVGLDRPVVFLDCPAYANLSKPPRFTQSEAGIINKHPKDLVEDILLAHSDPPHIKEARAKVKNLMHGVFKGEASSNAARVLMEFYGN